MKAEQIKKGFIDKNYDSLLLDLYEDEDRIEKQNQRYIKMLEKYIAYYGNDDVEIYNTPGRSEVCGNHTDHQHGCVVAASVNLDAIAAVSDQKDKVSIISDQFFLKDIYIDDLHLKEDEKGTSEALVRGILSRFQQLGHQIGGFKAYITSDVMIGAGLSSSAVFEVMIATILSGLYNEQKIAPEELAKIAQYAENVYFGKPCGLMDQCACAFGGLITIDFKDITQPLIENLQIDFSAFHHSLCIVDTKGSHSDLTDEYAAIQTEMKKVAHFFGKEVLREVDEAAFYEHLYTIKEQCGDRPVLRAIHYFNENKRVVQLVEALKENRFEDFRRIIQLSGNSSFKYLQNVYADAAHQSMSLALALSEMILKDKGVCRIHGGGFAGTIQTFVEDAQASIYKEEIEKIFGEGSCHRLKIRKQGSIRMI